MFHKKCITGYVLILGLICFLPLTGQASLDPPPFPFTVTVETDPSPVIRGAITLNVIVTSRDACSDIFLTEFTTDNLEYRGMPTLNATVSQSRMAEFKVPIDITANDTCGIEFLVSGCGLSQKAKAYWVFDDQSVKAYPGNPRLVKLMKYDPDDLTDMEIKNTTRKVAENRQGRQTQGYSDGEGNLISKEENDLRKAGLTDAENGQPRKMSTRECNLRRMGELEKKPLTDNDEQIFVLDGEVWTRSRGEFKFHKAEPSFNVSDGVRRKITSGASPADTTLFDVTLDLRDAEAYDLAESKIETLEPMDTPGYYRATATGAVLKELRLHGIKDAPYPELPRAIPLQRSAPPPKNDAPTSPDKDPSGTLFSDDFEGSFVWDVWEGGSSDYNWEDSWNRYHQGSWSAYCAGSDYYATTYDNNMEAWMEKSIDLYNHQQVTVSFYWWYSTENGYDSVVYCYSLDGYNYYDAIGPYTGSSGGWQYRSVSVGGEVDMYYFAFVFLSDESYCNYEGAYVDDFLISEVSLPDLVWDTPSGWYDAITISHSMYSTTTDYPLYAGQTAYINWGVSNLGAAASPQTDVDIKVDGSVIATRSVPALQSGETTTNFENVPKVFTPAGNHTVTIDIDPDNDLVEEDETNNVNTDTYNFIASQPDLKFFTPASWSNPLVITNDIYDRWMVTYPHAGEEVYIHWAFMNDGNGAAGTFYVRLYVDGSLECEEQIFGLDPGEEEWCEEYPLTLGQGSHTIEVRLDPTYAVGESNESNNITSVSRTWQYGTIEVSGNVYYEVRGSGPPDYESSDGFRVTLWDVDIPTYTSRIQLYETHTLSDGSYSFPPITNQDNDGTTLDLIVWVYSETDDVLVKEDFSDPKGLDISSKWVEENVASGTFNAWTGSDATYAIDDNGGYFYTAHNLQECYDFWYNTTGLSMSPTIAVIKANIGTAYNIPNDYIKIELLDIPGTLYSDHFDKYDQGHEFGHRIAVLFDFFKLHPAPSANWYDVTDYYTAACEAFAMFWSEAWVNNPIPMFYNMFDFNATTEQYDNAVFYNLENGEYGFILGNQLLGSANARGAGCVGSVTGILWDIFDDTPGLEDYSGGPGVDWGFLRIPHSPDGRGDYFTYPLNDIVSLLRTKHDPGVLINNINEFWNGWFRAPSNGNLQEMKDIYYEHAIDMDNFTDADDYEDTRPMAFSLSQNFPNPFNPSTTICYSIPNREHIRITIYNILGEEVRTLVDEIKTAGEYTVAWDGTDDAGNAVASGLYLSHMEAGEYSKTRSMTLLK